MGLASPEEQASTSPLDRKITYEGLGIDVLGDPGDLSDHRAAFSADPYGG